MNPLILLGGGGLVAYLLLRHRGAVAAVLSPPIVPVAPVVPVAPAPAPLQLPPARPPQITVPIPPLAGEVIAPTPAGIVQLTGRWGWPVPRYQGRAPVISDGFGSPRPPGKHMGVDLMFARVSTDPFAIGPNGSRAFVMPDAWMAVAAADGVLWSAGYTPRGFGVVIDHGNVATFYTHMDTLFVPETKPPAKGVPRSQLIPIKAGQPLGVIGADPLDPARLKHLHFELWAGGPNQAVDPSALMKTWQVFGPNDIAPFLPALTRNARKGGKPAKRSEFVHVQAYERRWPGTSLNPPR